MSPLSLRMSVAVIDANPLLADGISALLGQDSSFAARAIILDDSDDQTWPHSFDVIMIDPAQTSLAPQAIADDLGSTGAALVAYSDALSEGLARACIAAGFRGVLPKTVSFDLLKTALLTTAQGGLFIDAAFSSAIAQKLAVEDQPKPTQDHSLSDRELSVLKSVAHGKTMKEIGKELALSSKTVETYKARGSMKLNLSGRRQIVEFAIAQGWVEGARLNGG